MEVEQQNRNDITYNIPDKKKAYENNKSAEKGSYSLEQWIHNLNRISYNNRPIKKSRISIRPVE